MKSAENIIGVVLAGGLSSRMNGPDKTLMPLHGTPMIAHVIDRLRRQTPTVIVNANGDHERFAFLDVPVQSDTVGGFAGPLAGVLAGMIWAENHDQDVTHILSAAADTPFFPDSLLERFRRALEGAKDPCQAICMAYSQSNRHPTFGLWPVNLVANLEAFLKSGDRKVMLFAKQYELIPVNFELGVSGHSELDPFFNINTPDDFAFAEQIKEGLADA